MDVRVNVNDVSKLRAKLKENGLTRTEMRDCLVALAKVRLVAPLVSTAGLPSFLLPSGLPSALSLSAFIASIIIFFSFIYYYLTLPWTSPRWLLNVDPTPNSSSSSLAPCIPLS